MKYLIQHYVDDNLAEKKNKPAIKHGEKEITYAEVDTLSKKFAGYLDQTKIHQGELVAILSNVLPETISAMIGCLRQGVVYVPLNIHAPVQWLANIIKKANIKNLLVEDNFLEKALELKQECSIDNIMVIETNTNIELPNEYLSFQKTITAIPAIESYKNILADDLAYILYTSGSTGDPKGIMITHRNAYTFIGWMKKKFSVSSQDKILSRAPLQFDLSVFDIFTTFYAAATLVIKPLDFDEEPESIVNLIEEEQISIIYTVPSAYIRLLTRTQLTGRAASIRLILYAGEPFPPNYLHQFMKALPHIQVSNIYGPTETNIVTYYDMVTPPDPNTPIPLGYPAEDTEIIIVDEDLKPVPLNVTGEIMVRGGTVFAGYFNQAELTKQRLIQSPFHQQPSMCCLTGDLGKILPNGLIAYHGRKDNMVKTRGYRVEIDEVENAISSINDVAQVTVVAAPHDKYSNLLHAFVILKNKILSIESLTELTKNILPSYMVPYQFHLVEDLPKTSTGKVDRVSLKSAIT
jgi:amino acid adenylation domain-containing protein